MVAWKWGAKYAPKYVERLKAGVNRNIKMPHRFVCITDDPTGLTCETWPLPTPDLIKVRDGCYSRLIMFSQDWQARNNIDRLVCLDLDVVVTGSLDALFSRLEHFVILHGGHFNPCPFNGSVMLIDRGARPEIWSRFTVKEAEAVSMADGTWRGSDQTWISHVAPDAAGWTHLDGVYAFRKPGWMTGDDLPADARIVAFPGKKDPSQLLHRPWIRKHWLA